MTRVLKTLMIKKRARTQFEIVNTLGGPRLFLTKSLKNLVSN